MDNTKTLEILKAINKALEHNYLDQTDITHIVALLDEVGEGSRITFQENIGNHLKQDIITRSYTKHYSGEWFTVAEDGTETATAKELLEMIFDITSEFGSVDPCIQIKTK